MRRNHWFGVAVILLFLGWLAPDAHAKGSVRITLSTQPTAPLATYSPNNVVAVWIQNGAGQHVRTVALFSAVRTQHLVAYRAAAGITDPLTPDAVSGASRLNHTGPIQAIWNLKDKAGNIVPDGTYTIRMEFAEGNSAQANQNSQGTFTFVKGPNAQMQTGLTSGGFNGVTLNFDPNAVVCGDGVSDAPTESCDYTVQGSCIVNQTGCSPAVDKCMPNVFQGAPMTCNADCVPQAITACISGDMCCAPGCTESNDTDCRPGGGGGGGDDEPGDDVQGGCAVGAEGGLAVFLLFGLTLFVRRRR